MINGRIRGFQLHNIRMYFIFRILFFIWAIVIEKYDAQNILDPSDVAQDIWHSDNNISTKLPLSFDARQHWPACNSIGDIKNQGSCKSGWAVVIASVITDRMCINRRRPVEDLSAYNLLTCCDNCCGCQGGNILNGWQYVTDEGILTGGSYGSEIGCQPYMIPPCVGVLNKFQDCSWKSIEVPECLPNKCTNRLYEKTVYFGSKYRIEGYTLIPRTNHEAIMRELFLNGPIQVSMHLYDDLRWYKRGIYLRSSRAFEGDHAVKLIGWDEHSNWLLINSFGKMWGDEGTFLLPRNHMNGNCDFGYVIVAPILNGTQPYFSNAISFGTDRKLYSLHIVLLLYNTASKIEPTI